MAFSDTDAYPGVGECPRKRRQRTVLHPLLAFYFETVGLFLPPQNGRRKISTSAISPLLGLSSFTSTKSRCYSLPYHLRDGTGIFKAADVVQRAQWVEIPVMFESLETLEFMGYDPAMAKYLWDSWVNIPFDDDIHQTEWFEEWSLSHVKEDPKELYLHDAFGPEDNWEQALDELCVSTTLRQAIMAELFEDLRYTASCQFWVAEAMEDNLTVLKTLEYELKRNGEYLMSINFKGTGGTGSLARTVHAPYPPFDGRVLHTRRRAEIEELDKHSKMGPPPVRPAKIKRKKKMRGGRERGHKPLLGLSAFYIPSGRISDMKTKLYRVGNAQEAWRYSCTFQQHFFGTHLPSDFGSSLTYWTPQREVADRYAMWRKHKSPLSHIVITEVEVSEEFVAKMNQAYVWGTKGGKPNSDLHRIVHGFRRGGKKMYFEEDYSILSRANLVISHIAINHRSVHDSRAAWDYSWCPWDDDGWEKADVSDLLKVEIDGEEKLAIQWVFKDHVRGLVGYRFDDYVREYGKVVQYDMHRLFLGDIVTVKCLKSHLSDTGFSRSFYCF
ncbi:hypothetical protein TWF694_005487 [Orbilia ellipsospora]|uniref:Uncharacterized protein n=1 Tax=Orbilia ellipsospora TaxID=2528407 RepID=A0AAV9WTH7_9PEZI